MADRSGSVLPLGFAIALLAFALFLLSGRGGDSLPVLTGLWQRIYLAALYGVLLTNALAARAAIG